VSARSRDAQSEAVQQQNVGGAKEKTHSTVQAAAQRVEGLILTDS